mgnify:CR=1 FL=1
MTEIQDPTPDSAAVDDVDAASRSNGGSSRSGPVRLPRRIELDACLMPGKADSRRLLLTWFVKNSFWWMTFGGAAFASAVHFVERTDNDLQVDYSSPESVAHALL